MGRDWREEMAERLASSSWLTTLMAWVTALVTAALLILAVLYWPSVSARTSEVSQSTRVQGCRSQSSALVTEARTRFDVARATRDTAATHLELLIAEGLVAAVTSDEATFERVLPLIESTRREVSDAEDVVVDATRALEAENARHHDAVQLSVEDPEAFLRLCREFAP